MLLEERQVPRAEEICSIVHVRHISTKDTQEKQRMNYTIDILLSTMNEHGAQIIVEGPSYVSKIMSGMWVILLVCLIIMIQHFFIIVRLSALTSQNKEEEDEDEEVCNIKYVRI
jgi:uncharacterized membrane protein